MYSIDYTNRFKKDLKRCQKRGQWKCHIEPDWLMIWEQNDDELILLMLNTGTHSDIFGKGKKR